jgi:transcriptional regulator with XRE-family HTH domain
MTQNTEDRPAARPVETVARRMKEVRRRRGYSAAQLAERMRAAGVEWDRNIVANLETGRRASVDVAELLALAYVLAVAPVHLLIPTDDELAPYHVTPSSAVRAGRARAWVRGDDPLSTDRRDYYSEVPEHEWTPPARREGPLSVSERQAIVEELERRGLGDLRVEQEGEGGNG